MFEPVMIKRKPIPFYPGKPGPAYQGGLKRPFLMNVTVSTEENEYIVRKCYELKIPKSEYVRRCSLPMGWDTELNAMREAQKGIEEFQIIRAVKQKPSLNGKSR